MTGKAFAQDRLDLLRGVVEDDIAQRKYWGTAITITQHGRTVLDFATGHVDEAQTTPLATDTVFSIFSVTKAFINVLILRAVELGRLALTTRVSEIIPEFSGAPRDRATIYHFLTHTNGLPGVWEPRPGLYFDDLTEIVEAVIENIHGASEPGTRCDYAPMANHALLGEVLRRIDPAKRSINDILEQDLFIPLGMDDTRLGIRPHMRDRHAFPDFRGIVPIKELSRNHPGDHGIFGAETQEAVWMGSASTTRDLTRFADMLRRGGELDGVRILSPVMVALARRNHTGTLPNELYKTVALRAGREAPPAYIGLGFSVRGDALVTHQFGTLTSPETFGNYGAGSTVYWIDPELDATFVGLSTGLLAQAPNIDRFQRLSDIVVGALS
ncbi:serine hydrolase domain-containing protein [Microbacterium rhizophilus]|uniref:serine hydrolase domain-containing protein n=1 Tax=Microbacterium rhizophilus TaxID=3138934 RepID=UPI0031EBD389